MLRGHTQELRALDGQLETLGRSLAARLRAISSARETRLTDSDFHSPEITPVGDRGSSPEAKRGIAHRDSADASHRSAASTGWVPSRPVRIAREHALDRRPRPATLVQGRAAPDPDQGGVRGASRSAEAAVNSSWIRYPRAGDFHGRGRVLREIPSAGLTRHPPARPFLAMYNSEHSGATSSRADRSDASGRWKAQ